MQFDRLRRREFITLLCLQMISQSAWAQEDHVVTAQTTASSRADACTSSSGKAYNLCTIQGWFNVTRINCECTQGEAHGLPTWECVASATCKKGLADVPNFRPRQGCSPAPTR